MPSRWKKSIERNIALQQHLTARQLALYWSQVRKTRGCWHWQGRKDHKGYGVHNAGLYTLRAHRTALILVGALPQDWESQACHTCLNNPACVNPAHLYWGSAKDNVQDSIPSLQARTGKQIQALKYARKLTPEQVAEIWRAYHRTKESAKSIGKRFGVSGTHAQYIGKQKARRAFTEAHLASEKKKRYPLLGEGHVGQKHWKAKLSDAQVQAIRKALCAGSPIAPLAKKYGVTNTNISFIAVGRTRKQLPWPPGCAPRVSKKTK